MSKHKNNKSSKPVSEPVESEAAPVSESEAAPKAKRARKDLPEALRDASARIAKLKSRLGAYSTEDETLAGRLASALDALSVSASALDAFAASDLSSLARAKAARVSVDLAVGDRVSVGPISAGQIGTIVSIDLSGRGGNAQVEFAFGEQRVIFAYGLSMLRLVRRAA